MEDILNVYRMDYDKEIPLVCMDEQPVQLLDDKILPIPIKPGSVRKEDYEYIRRKRVYFSFYGALKRMASCKGLRAADKKRLGPADPGTSYRTV